MSFVIWTDGNIFSFFYPKSAKFNWNKKFSLFFEVLTKIGSFSRRLLGRQIRVYFSPSFFCTITHTPLKPVARLFLLQRFLTLIKWTQSFWCLNNLVFTQLSWFLPVSNPKNAWLWTYYVGLDPDCHHYLCISCFFPVCFLILTFNCDMNCIIKMEK